jgi:hypothetical protein
MDDGGGEGVLPESAGLEASGVPTAHLRDPRSLSRSRNDEFVPEIELKLSNLYRKPTLSSCEGRRKRECGTGGVWIASSTSARSKVSFPPPKRRICTGNRAQVDEFVPETKLVNL